MDMMTRQGFVRATGAFAFAPFAGTLFAADEKPLFRMGVMTDTHVGKTPESCSRLKAALELFKARGVDMVVNNGDIADQYYPTGYRAIREIYSAVYPAAAARPREVWVYAWHDAIYFKKGASFMDTPKYAHEAFAEVRRLLEASDPVTASFTFRGIPMIVFNQFETKETAERMLAAAVAANPGKPVFVFSHIPPRATVYNSWNWGHGDQRKLFDRYPQVVAFSGHVHGSLRNNDLFIWQKDFTAINAGCLQVWDGLLANACPRNDKQSYGVLTVDVFPSRLLVRRFDVRDGSEIDPENPWNVALPFAAEKAAYAVPRKKARAAVPQYAADARLAVAPSDDGSLKLTFPEVSGAVRAFTHRAELERRGADGAWTRVAIRETFGDFYLREPRKEQSIAFESGYFAAGERVRLSVRPLNAYGVGGKALVAECDAPAVRGFTTVLDVAGPLTGFPFARADAPDKPLAPNAEGFFRPFCTSLLLKLPEGVFAGPEGTRFRLVCDMRLKQSEEGGVWELGLRDAKTNAVRAATVYSVEGDPGVLRYVFEFTQPKDASGSCKLTFGRGYASSVRFERIRLDRKA